LPDFRLRSPEILSDNYRRQLLNDNYFSRFFQEVWLALKEGAFQPD
jgi:hypothetical protein